MKNKLTLSLVLVLFLSGVSFGQNQKLAQAGMKFLNVSMDPRAVGMADAITSVEGTSTSMFYNPAGMARMSTFAQATISRTQWIADINHIYGSIALSPENGQYGVIGFTLQSVDYGELYRTIRADNEQGYMDVGTFKPTAIAFGVGYARSLSDRFSVGGNIRYVMQDLGNGVSTLDLNGNPLRSTNSVEVLSFDFGVLYKTGLKSLNFAMSVRNFSKEIKYEREGFQLPLIFRVGASVNAMDFFTDSKNSDSFLLSVDATHPRDFPEQVNLGAEYVFLKTLALRAGYMFNNDLYGFTAGAGLMKTIEGVGLGVDYSYTRFDIFGNINRFSVQLSF